MDSEANSTTRQLHEDFRRLSAKLLSWGGSGGGWSFTAQVAQKGPDARRRPPAAREAYSLYVERAAGGRQRSRWTLFSDLPLVHDEAAVDTQRLPRHITGARPREEGDHVRY